MYTWNTQEYAVDTRHTQEYAVDTWHTLTQEYAVDTRHTQEYAVDSGHIAYMYSGSGCYHSIYVFRQWLLS